jgi:hypothetical protein
MIYSTEIGAIAVNDAKVSFVFSTHRSQFLLSLSVRGKNNAPNIKHARASAQQVKSGLKNYSRGLRHAVLARLRFAKGGKCLLRPRAPMCFPTERHPARQSVVMNFFNKPGLQLHLQFLCKHEGKKCHLV